MYLFCRKISFKETIPVKFLEKKYIWPNLKSSLPFAQAQSDQRIQLGRKLKGFPAILKHNLKPLSNFPPAQAKELCKDCNNENLLNCIVACHISSYIHWNQMRNFSVLNNNDWKHELCRSCHVGNKIEMILERGFGIIFVCYWWPWVALNSAMVVSCSGASSKTTSFYQGRGRAKGGTQRSNFTLQM